VLALPWPTQGVGAEGGTIVASSLRQWTCWSDLCTSSLTGNHPTVTDMSDIGVYHPTRNPTARPRDVAATRGHLQCDPEAWWVIWDACRPGPVGLGWGW